MSICDKQLMKTIWEVETIQIMYLYLYQFFIPQIIYTNTSVKSIDI